jgi:capsular polysaccharide biosynthesis protein
MTSTPPVDETDEPTLDAADAGAGPDITDLRHLLAILSRWRILIASGTVFVVASTVALLALTPPAYSATSVLLVDQPVGVANGDEGLGVAQKLVNLLPTYADLATTDFTLAVVKDRLEIRDSLDDLRGRIDARADNNTLLLRITARDSDARAAEDLASAVGKATKDGIAVLQREGGVPDKFQFVVTQVSAPDASQPSRNELRTVLLAAAFGLAVMAGLAIALEIVFERR